MENRAAQMKRWKSALQTTHKNLVATMQNRDALVIDSAADPIDQLRSAIDRDLAVQCLDSKARLLHEVELALLHMKSRSYGECEACGEQIAPRRLDVVPWARLCLSCQSEAESVETHELAHA